MAVKVRFFAALREKLGRESLDVASTTNMDMNALLEVIRDQLGDDAIETLRGVGVRVALNREFVDGACVMRDGDEIAFMPAITGG